MCGAFAGRGLEVRTVMSLVFESLLLGLDPYIVDAISVHTCVYFCFVWNHCEKCDAC